jgi:glutathione S-transferase
MLHRRAEANLLDAAATYFHHATPGLGPTSRSTKTGSGARRTGSARSPACGISTRSWPPQPYLAGERFTMADITAFAGLAYADIASIEVPADLVRLKAWRARVAERPSVAHA